jgi:DNA polymerase-3 subunit alpha
MMTSPTNKQLIPLHTHTVYSVLDGASDISEYVEWCKDNGSPALGITDHGWMIGLMDLIDQCKENDLKPLPGCEFYIVPSPDYEFAGKPYDYYHVTAWAVNQVGYRNLLKLGSLSFGEDTVNQKYYDSASKSIIVGQKNRVVKKFGQVKPRITFEELFEFSEGLVLGSGCLIGSINKALLQKEPSGAERNLLKMLDVFRGRFFLELMPHNCTHNWDRKKRQFTLNECNDFSPDGDLQKPCNLHNIELAKKHKLPLLMTIDSHFVHADQKSVQDVLLQNGSPDGWRFHNSYHMLTTDQAWEHWVKNYGDTKENRLMFAESVENNHAIADMVDLTLEHKLQQPQVNLDIAVSDVPDEKDRLKLQIMRQVAKHGRMKWDDPKYTERLNMEIKVICDNGIIDFSKYFLFLEQWAQWTRDHSILSAPGRGSAAGSLLCYLLKITHLDPFEFNLPFERFLSQGRLKRGKFPDIDWDLGNRNILLAKLAETYGEKFAQCSTHGMLKVKSAIKDACRVLLGRNSQDKRVNEVTKTIPLEPQGVESRNFLLGYTDKEGHVHEGHLDQNLKLKKFFVEYSDVYEMVLQLLGVPRSVGRHASAYFISDRPIWESSPLCDISGHRCTQYTAEPAEKAGLIKFDFLRVNTLADISNTIRLIQRRHGHNVTEKKMMINGKEFTIYSGDIPIEKVPDPTDPVALLDVYRLPESPGVFDDLCRGDTTGVFQLNTPLLTKACKDVQPRSIEDIGAIVALGRPGPMGAKIEDGETTMTNAYILRRAGKMAVTYAHPDLEPILKSTYGVAVYQEQLQAMFSEIAGYTPEEADEMREIFAKKKRQKMEEILPELKRRLTDRGWTPNQINVFESLCISSASYSFNRAHSASYAMAAYQCAFLKHHFYLEWWTAVLQNAKVEDIRKKGYATVIKDILVMPHVNGPTNTFELSDEDGKIHAPLYLIDGIGEMACKEFERVRAEGGDFTSLEDCFQRVNKRVCSLQVFHRLILCGGFDRICPNTDYKALISRYHVLRKAHKKNQPVAALLENMIKLYGQIQEGTLSFDVDELFYDDFELEIKRTELLPIYRIDVHEHFNEYLQKSGVLYDNSGKATVYCQSVVGILRNNSEIESHVSCRPNFPAAFIGLVQDFREFQYKDKKTGERVTACSVQVTNDGDSLECVLWPNIYQSDLPKGEPTGLVMVKGKLKESREPGKWSLWCDRYVTLKGGK